MSQLNRKILASGCGFSWSQQEKPTWINILKLLNIDIVDVGGPAISNQTIINNAFDYLLTNNNVTDVIIQITDVSKLDVELTPERKSILVDQDPIRNFVYKNVWPSSSSSHHMSKQLWYQWLHSPNLERQTLCHMLILLDHWCRGNQVNLIVSQGYPIEWDEKEKNFLKNVINDIDQSIDDRYILSSHHQYHDHSNNNTTVPCIEFQVELAEYFLHLLNIDRSDKLEKIKKFLDSKHC
jgi:hypothetical protein